ncbi:hypothetical protein HID58_038988 [Brassica napus]|uniref:Disease resistance protein n=1 Tax=Brassica napus TaxID=3708 RepID=A0ABQ8BSK5_BRANA|nr:hypothetical protein HID58_038988 [Brassica napus]
MIEKNVADVSEELNRCTPSKDFDDLVGLEAHVAKLCSMLCLESDEVRMIGIWGPIGIGKTTIARALYSQLSAAADDNFHVLNMKGCSKLRIFPEISSQVKFMSVGETAIEEVPLSISLWPQLISLEMSGCKKLKTFPKLPASVEVLDLSSTGIEEIPWWVENASQLLIMCMANCKKLKCVPPSIYKMKHLEDVDLSGCSELRPVLSSRYRAFADVFFIRLLHSE